MREKGVSKEGDRSNEVDSLFSVFSASGEREYRSVIGTAAFFLILPPST